MTFKVAGVRRFVCRNSRYSSIDGCMLFPLLLVIDLPCYSTTAIQILRHVNTRHEASTCCTFSAMSELFLT